MSCGTQAASDSVDFAGVAGNIGLDLSVPAAQCVSKSKKPYDHGFCRAVGAVKACSWPARTDSSDFFSYWNRGSESTECFGLRARQPPCTWSGGEGSDARRDFFSLFLRGDVPTSPRSGSTAEAMQKKAWATWLPEAPRGALLGHSAKKPTLEFGRKLPAVMLRRALDQFVELSQK